MASTSFTTRYTLYDVLGSGDFGTVFKALDRQTDTVVAVKVVAGYLSSPVYSLKNESSFIEQLNRRFNEFTHSIVLCTDKGHNIHLDDLGSLASRVDILLGDEENEDIHVFYFGMELLKNHIYKITKELATEESLDIMFELYMTLELINKYNLDHEDIGPQNILYVETDEVRCYKINKLDYVVRSKYLPKIIDWSEHVGDRYYHEPKWGVERLLYFMDIEQNYPKGLDDIFQDFKKNPSLEHPIFDLLRQREILEGDKVKYFLPVDI